MVYRVKYIGSNGKAVQEEIEADSRTACFAKLKSRGITPIAVEKTGICAMARQGVAGLQQWRKWRYLGYGAAVAGICVGVMLMFRDGELAEEPAAAMVSPQKVKMTPPQASQATHEGVEVSNTSAEAAMPPAAQRRTVSQGSPRRRPRNPAIAAALSCAGQPPLVDMTSPDAPEGVERRHNGVEYGTRLQAQLAQYATPGQFVGTPDPFTDAEALEFCQIPVEFSVEDSEEVLAQKETVRQLQGELKEYIQNGGHANDYMMELMRRQDAEFETLQTVRQDVIKMCRDGQIREAEQALEAYNRYLADKGLPPVSFNVQMQHYKRLYGFED